ncbi:MAG: hypothetical protein FWE71_02215 [Nocardioidaceae bacterium]|nr:hypothetical protein [Nocardioidaceae bacterium]MCL2611600.1 hypothetical protein [Nocardioidaceae bacterium]
MNRISDLIESESRAAEEADDSVDLVLPSNVRVTRGHDRSNVLQVHLNEDDYRLGAKLAEERGVPASTFAAGSTPSANAGRSAMSRLRCG